MHTPPFVHTLICTVSKKHRGQRNMLLERNFRARKCLDSLNIKNIMNIVLGDDLPLTNKQHVITPQ